MVQKFVKVAEVKKEMKQAWTSTGYLVSITRMLQSIEK